MTKKEDEKVRIGTKRALPPAIRTGSVFIRALHLFPASMLLAGIWFGIPKSELGIFWMFVGISGIILLATEMFSHPGLYRQGAGLAIFLKLVLVSLISFAGEWAGVLMILAFFIAVLGAHFPKHLRHRILF